MMHRHKTAFWPKSVVPTDATPDLTLVTVNSNLPSRTGVPMPATLAGADVALAFSLAVALGVS